MSPIIEEPLCQKIRQENQGVPNSIFLAGFVLAYRGQEIVDTFRMGFPYRIMGFREGGKWRPCTLRQRVVWCGMES